MKVHLNLLKKFHLVFVFQYWLQEGFTEKLDIKFYKKTIENYNNSGKIYVNNFGKIIQTFLSLYD